MNPPALRILHLNSLLTGGGTDDQCAKLALGLQRLGQHVAVAGPEGRSFSKIIRESGVPFHATPPEGPLKLRFILAAARLIRSERIQIVHGHHGRDLWPTILAARWSGVRPKVVLTRHMAKSPSSWFSRNFLLAQCDALIAVSKFVSEVLRRGHYEPQSSEPERRARHPLRGDFRKLHQIYGAMDVDEFRPRPAQDADVRRLRAEWGLEAEHFAFGVVGGFAAPRGKGQREFLQAAARVHEQAPHARFLLIGAGNLERTLRADIDRLGLRDKARLTGQCADMAAGMNALDCLVHPQVGTEALGLVVCEAHACGRPVIASALDGIPEAFAIGALGALVPPENIGELSAKMLRVLGTPAPAESTRHALHEQVSRVFGLEVCARQVRELYGNLLLPAESAAGNVAASSRKP